jgi:20S proteasome alpha/beta subunit
MTICIAAIAENEDIIAIADKKLTLSHGLTSVYEINENKKIITLTPNCIVMFAGDIIAANEVLKLAQQTIADTDSVNDVARKIQAAHALQFKDVINTQVLQRYNLDIDAFNAQQQMLEQIFVRSIIESIDSISLGVEILIVGKDNNVPRILKMTQNGAIEDDTPTGYACIGSGSAHANLSLIESETHAAANKESLVYAVIKAKKRAEYDPNVGHMSSMVVINNGIRSIDDSVVDNLWQQYDKSVERIHTITKKSSITMKGLVYGSNSTQTE